MLEAGDRQLLLDALRPPEGYRLDQGLGTTYTLDLLALLMAPVAFTMFDRNAGEDGAAHDSLEVLESLRRYADRLTLFCQAGQTTIPRAQYPQLAFVEQAVVECRSPNGGAFHPKFWVLRFEGPGPVKYRVLCLSRNLVFAQCWDTILTLDGELEDRARPIGRSRPLAEFVAALPSFAVRPPAAEIRERSAALAAELQSTRFEPPEGFDDFTFWPIGLPDRRARLPFRQVGKRLLIVSPFLAGSRIEQLAEESTETMLVSTPSELARLPRRPHGVQKFFVLNERVQAEIEPSTEAGAATLSEAVQLRDLHAKLYVTEIGATAHIWTGSANATAAAFDRNVEFMVELTGPRRLVGLDRLMEPEKGEIRFRNLLIPAIELVAKEAEDPDVHALEHIIEQCRADLAAARLEVHVAAEANSFDLTVWLPESCIVKVPDGLSVRCWPSMIARESAIVVSNATGPQPIARFEKVTRQALTSFFAFEISGRLNAVERTAAFVLNLPLVGAPEGRKEDVLRLLLKDRRRLLRFLMLLLSGEGAALLPPGFAADDEHGHGGRMFGGFTANGLFEMLMRALDEAPHRLDHLETLLAQLRSGRDGDASLPEGFDAIWEPILAHRRAMAQESNA